MFQRPFSHHAHPREIIRQFTPNWFTVTMGTGVLALLLAQHPGAVWIWRGNIVLFALFTLLYAARWTLYPREASRIFGHPVMPMFLGAIPMGLATIVNGCVVFAHAIAVAEWLWCVDAGLAILAGLAVPFAMFTRQTHAMESMTGVWLLPIVACEVAAASAGLLAPHLAASAGAPLLVAGYVLWSLSVPLALGILVILFLRLVLHKLPGSEMAASSWLALGPLGTGALALLLLGRAAPGLLPADVALVAHGAGVLGGLLLWGYGSWWLLIAIGITLSYLPRGLPFNLGWWGFTFPLGVFILATKALAVQTGLAGFAVAAAGLTGLFVCLWLLVALRTLAGAYQGRLFVAPCLGSPAVQSAKVSTTNSAMCAITEGAMNAST